MTTGEAIRLFVIAAAHGSVWGAGNGRDLFGQKTDPHHASDPHRNRARAYPFPDAL